jgi:DNA-binding transcriptional ArsR family regulator
MDTSAAPAFPKIDKTTSKKDMEVYFAQARKASELLKALSHETRLVILCLLAEREWSVSDLEEILSMPQSAVSQQLARLRFDRLVNARRDGRMIYYSLANEEVTAVIGMLHQLFCAPVRDAEDRS